MSIHKWDNVRSRMSGLCNWHVVSICKRCGLIKNTHACLYCETVTFHKPNGECADRDEMDLGAYDLVTLTACMTMLAFFVATMVWLIIK